MAEVGGDRKTEHKTSDIDDDLPPRLEGIESVPIVSHRARRAMDPSYVPVRSRVSTRERDRRMTKKAKYPWPSAAWLARRSPFVVDSDGRRYFDAASHGPQVMTRQHEPTVPGARLFWLRLPDRKTRDDGTYSAQAHDRLEFPNEDSPSSRAFYVTREPDGQRREAFQGRIVEVGHSPRGSAAAGFAWIVVRPGGSVPEFKAL